MAGAGDTFVVSWTSPDDGDGAGVYARRYDSAGQPLGSQFQVNTHTSDYQGVSAVAAMPSGAFVVTWISYGQDGSDEGVFAQGIAHPTVARDKARVRTIVTATHTREGLEHALDAFARVGRELGLI